MAEGKNAWAKSALESVYIKKWLRSEDAILFKLSNKVTQTKFNDGSEILIDTVKNLVIFVNEQGLRKSMPLSLA